MITIASIQRAVAAECEVPVHIMRDPSPTSEEGLNPWPISRARQAAMALSVLLTEHSFPRIGYYFGGRDSTTVRHAWKVVHRRRQSDPKLHDALCRLTLELVRH